MEVPSEDILDAIDALDDAKIPTDGRIFWFDGEWHYDTQSQI